MLQRGGMLLLCSAPGRGCDIHIPHTHSASKPQTLPAVTPCALLPGDAKRAHSSLSTCSHGLSEERSVLGNSACTESPTPQHGTPQHPGGRAGERPTRRASADRG